MDHVTVAHGAGRLEDAELLAIKVLNFIVDDVDRIIQFLNVTGLQPETIRESAKSPLFLLGVLDYIAKDDELLKEIHMELNIRPEAILMASAQLTPQSEWLASERKLAAAAPVLPRRNLYH